MLQTLGRPDVQPDPQRRLWPRRLRDIRQNAPLIPPKTRREHRQPRKHVRVLEPQIQADQSAQRRPAQPRPRRLRLGPVARIYPRLQLLNQQPPISVSLASSHPRISRRRVLGHAPQSGVAYPDQDQRLRSACCRHAVRGRPCAPRMTRNVRRPVVEQILPVLQIQHWKPTFRLSRILYRQMYGNCSILRQDF